MHRTSRRRTRGLPTTWAILATLPLFVGVAARPSAAQNVTVHLMNMTSARSYSVFKNSTPLTTVNSTALGTVRFDAQVTTGDVLRITDAGSGAQPPSAPTGLAATGDSVGCAHLTWNANPEGDLVGYRVYFGMASATYGDSVDVAATATAHDLCGLGDGAWFFAVRARNTTGLLSALSAEASASVSNGNAQPPSPPLIVVVVPGQSGCFDVGWVPVGDPTVVGYVVYYGLESVEGGGATAYDDSVEVGATGQASICSLAPATYYVAVRSKNHLGMTSAYSAERPVTVPSTAVLISFFGARPEEQSVHLEWGILADEALRGFRIARAQSDVPGSEVTINGPNLLPPGSVYFVDRTVAGDTRYDYTLVVVKADGSEMRSAPASVRTNPLALFLEQNLPNPFNPTTSISFVLAKQGRVRLTVHDVRGLLVATLADREMAPGREVVVWDGVNDGGRTVASGTYFYRLQTASGVRTRKMVLLK